LKNKNLITYTIIFFLLILLSIFIISYQYNKNQDSLYLQSINYSKLIELLDAKETFIMYIGSANCSACQTFAPIFEEVLSEYNIRAKYINLDNYGNDRKTVTELFKIDSIPTVIFINNGEEISVLNRIDKIISKDEIIEKLKNNDYIK